MDRSAALKLLHQGREGVAQWNEHRSRMATSDLPSVGIDLRKADLSGLDLTGANLSGVSLGKANLRKAILHSANLQGADLREVNLRGAVLKEATFSQCNLAGADLTAARISPYCLEGAITSEATVAQNLIAVDNPFSAISIDTIAPAELLSRKEVEAEVEWPASLRDRVIVIYGSFRTKKQFKVLQTIREVIRDEKYLPLTVLCQQEHPPGYLQTLIASVSKLGWLVLVDLSHMLEWLAVQSGLLTGAIVRWQTEDPEGQIQFLFNQEERPDAGKDALLRDLEQKVRTVLPFASRPGRDFFSTEVQRVLHLQRVIEQAEVIRDQGRGKVPVRRSLGEEKGKVAPPIAASEPLRSDPPLYCDENVQFTVYRPKGMAPEQWESLVAFAHLTDKRPDAPSEEPHPLEEVRRQAKQVLGSKAENYQSLSQDSRAAVPREGEITFRPQMNGIVFNPPEHSFLWVESVQRAEFRMKGDAKLEGTTARGSLSVYLGSILLAEIPLAIPVTRAAVPGSDLSQTTAASASPYRKIFASYSHKDLAIVRQFERYAQALGDSYLRDWVTLRSGEPWSERLLEMIDEADVFQLFWSSHSMASDYVQREWEHALGLGREGFIRPLYWEEPLPEDPDQGLPPEELQRLHFARIPVAAVDSPDKLEEVDLLDYDSGLEEDEVVGVDLFEEEVEAHPELDAYLEAEGSAPKYRRRYSGGRGCLLLFWLLLTAVAAWLWLYKPELVERFLGPFFK